MKIKFAITVVLLSLVSAGCLTLGTPEADKAGVRIYRADLDGDGNKEIIETQDKSATDSMYLVTVKNNDRTKKTIDSFSVGGKIKNIVFPELNHDGQEWMVIYSETKDKPYNIAIYKIDNNEKLSEIFSAGSMYGVEVDFDTIPRIKIGKAPRDDKSLNLTPDWDTWVWLKDKFVIDRN